MQCNIIQSVTLNYLTRMKHIIDTDVPDDIGVTEDIGGIDDIDIIDNIDVHGI